MEMLALSMQTHLLRGLHSLMVNRLQFLVCPADDDLAGVLTLLPFGASGLRFLRKRQVA